MKGKFGRDRTVGTIAEIGDWLVSEIEKWTPEEKAQARAELDRKLPTEVDNGKRESGNAEGYGELDVEGNREDDTGRKSQNEGTARSALGSAETERWRRQMKNKGVTTEEMGEAILRTIKKMSPKEKAAVRAELDRSLRRPSKTPSGEWVN